MPRHSTDPILFNKVPRLDIRQLKRQGLIRPAHKASTSIVWRSHDGAMIFEVFVKVATTNRPHVDLIYEHYNERIKYRVHLEALRYGLGGRNWYFRCPRTGTRCSVLHFVNGYFVHRTAFKGCFYEIQTKSHSDRQTMRIYKRAIRGDKAKEQMRQRYFKSHYAGKPTKRYLRLMEDIGESKKVSQTDVELLYIS